MELSTNYLSLLICISLIVIIATLIYMYITKKTFKNVPEKNNNRVKIDINKNVEYQHENEEHHSDEEQENTTEAYNTSSGSFRIKPKHVMNDDEDDMNTGSVLENFNAPKTRDGNIRQSIGDDEVLHSRGNNSLSFIDKLQKRFDSNSSSS